MQSIEENWNMMADAYEQFTEGEDSYSYKIEWPCISDMLPELEGKTVIDLGCGTGRFTFLLEKMRPRKIVGIDLSQKMVDCALEKAKRQKSAACFYKGDISEMCVEEKFDFCFASTVSHYIKDLKRLFTNIYNILNQDGICIMSVMNPVYTAQYPIKHGDAFPNDDEWTVRYLDQNERSYVQPWIEYNSHIDNYLSCSYHHTFSDYVNAIVLSGFSILEMQEPAPPEEWKEKYPNRYNAFIETPSYLIMKIKKQGNQ